MLPDTGNVVSIAPWFDLRAPVLYIYVCVCIRLLCFQSVAGTRCDQLSCWWQLLTYLERVHGNPCCRPGPRPEQARPEQARAGQSSGSKARNGKQQTERASTQHWRDPAASGGGRVGHRYQTQKESPNPASSGCQLQQAHDLCRQAGNADLCFE